MSSAQGTASPRAPRGKHQQPQQGPTAPAPHTNNGRQGRRPKGNRVHHSGNQAGASPSRHSSHNVDPTLAESAVFSSEEAQLPPQGPRNPKKHTQSQPSAEHMFPPPRAQASLTDTESAPKPITATPAKNQGAYAGPTFHASPAPSALPIPKFLSRSVPAKTRMDPPTPPPEESSESGSSPSPLAASPSRAPMAVPPRNEMSPLDLLFKADRAERANQLHGSPQSNNVFNQAQASRPQHHKHDSHGSLNAPFPIELDGEARNLHMPPPSCASPAGHRSVTDPNKVPQLKDAPQSPSNNDVMQDLLSRLSMSQKKAQTATPPRPDVQGQSNTEPRNQTPSPFQDGRSAVRSASGPSTPTPPAQENPDFFYGNRNLSPLFKAAKGDTSKRNSGLRTEITADSPLVAQGMFQDFPSAPPPQAMDPETFSRNQLVGGNAVPTGPRRGSAPYVQPYRDSPNNRRRTPGRPGPQQSRPDSCPSKNNASGPGFNSNRAGVNGAPASVKKPATSMMTFVPSSVAAKKHSSSTPAPTVTCPQAKASPPPDTLALEHDLKRLLNMKSVDGAPSAI